MIVTARTAREAVETVRQITPALRRVSVVITRHSNTEWKVEAK